MLEQRFTQAYVVTGDSSPSLAGPAKLGPAFLEAMYLCGGRVMVCVGAKVCHCLGALSHLLHGMTHWPPAPGDANQSEPLVMRGHIEP